MNETTARQILWPDDPEILVRVAFLYVGQGASAVVFVANGKGYDVLLVDINLDNGAGGIDVPLLMSDLLGEQSLHAFVNTHPHDDHLCGVEKLSDAVTIGNVWHSGHVPSKKYGACYEELKRVIEKVKKNGGSEVVLEASRTSVAVGDAYYHVVSPAEHVTDDVNEDDADARYRRIHEMCVVIKLGKDDTWIMIAGDADHVAFDKHITEYHKKRLGAFALGGSHHGSRTFFREDEEDEPYLEGLEAIDPSYVVISAPKQTESKHGHPDDDAIELYADQVGEDNVLHTGEQRECFLFDIYRDGTYSDPSDDEGRLAEKYGLSSDDEKSDVQAKGGYSPRTRPTTPQPGRFA
jgi:competence protein ComEC